MSKTITGGCLCGEIRYECEGDPVRAFICHCTDCQRFTGSAFSPELFFPKESFRLLSGTPSGHTVAAESGNSMERQFCGRCGSSLFCILEKLPNLFSVNAGSLDDKTVFKPSLQVWTRSQMGKFAVSDDLEKFEKGPPPPAPG